MLAAKPTSPLKTMSEQPRATLTERMARLKIMESDLEEQFIRSSGPGGQHVNKVSTCVRLRHRPSGVEVRCQAERSRGANRERARMELCDKLEAIQRTQQHKRARARFLRNSQAKAQKRSAKLRRLVRKTKTHRSKTKSLRRRPHEHD